MLNTPFMVKFTFLSKTLGWLYAGQWLTQESVDKMPSEERRNLYLKTPYSTAPMDQLWGYGLVFLSKDIPHPKERQSYEEILEEGRRKFEKNNGNGN